MRPAAGWTLRLLLVGMMAQGKVQAALFSMSNVVRMLSVRIYFRLLWCNIIGAVHVLQ